jgi:hypothetical protein
MLQVMLAWDRGQDEWIVPGVSRSLRSRPIYTEVNAAAARAALDELAATWAPATVRSSGCGRTPGTSSSRPGLRPGDPQGPMLDE